MNNKSRTKHSLKTSKVFISYPYEWLNKVTLFLLLFTVTVFTILVKLGLWQVSRAEEKSQLLAQMAARQTQAPLNFTQLQTKLADEAVMGYRFTAVAKPTPSPVWLLDNQIYQGKVGYLALQALQIEAGQPWLLVELGFIAMGATRDILPSVIEIDEPIMLNGRLYQKQINPLNHKLIAEVGESIRIQSLNIPAMAEMLGQPLLPVVFQPERAFASNLPHPWQPFPLSPQKHWGYAVQWFSLALVFVGLMLWQAIKYKVRITTKMGS